MTSKAALTTFVTPVTNDSGSTPKLGNVTGRGDNGTVDVGSPSDFAFERYIWIYSLPVIFLVGVAGNVCTILVMRRRRMRGTATSVYLTLLAIADTSVLVTGVIPEWLIQAFAIDISEIHPWICKFERFLFYTTGDVAVWILVAFTCDRCIAVCFPLKKRHLCTERRAYLACLIIALLGCAKNTHVFWTRGAVYDADEHLVENCGKPEPYTYFEKKIRPWIVMALVSVGPFSVILVCNVIIVRQLVWSGRMRSTASCQDNKQRAFTQTTAMCLSTSFAFLVLITPSIVLLIGKPYWTSADRPNVAYDIAKAVNNQLMFLNHSINFFLYCLTGARFRAEFRHMLTRCRAGDAPAGSQSQSPGAQQYSVAASVVKASPTTDTLTVIGSGDGDSTSSKDIELPQSNGTVGPTQRNGVYVVKETTVT